MKLSEKIGYGFGDMSSSMFWKLFSYYLPIFYSNIFGLGLGHTGLLFLVTRIWDAVSDPMMGIIADRTDTKWGKYRPYLLYTALPFALCGIFLFTTPDMGETGKLIWAYVSYILMMTIYTCINVPYGAMLGVMSSDSNTKTVLSSFRMFFAYAGSFIVLFLWEPLINMFDHFGCTPQSSWQLAMTVIATCCFLLFLACFGMTREHVKSVSTVSIAKDLKLIVRNKPWWILIGAGLCFNLFNTLRGATTAYYFSDYIGENTLLNLGNWSFLFYAGLFLSIGEIGNMIGVALAVPVSMRSGKKKCYITMMGILTVLSIAFFFVPASPAGCWGMLVLQVLISICTGIVSPLIWSMYADVSDYVEEKYNTASTGLIFSSSSMAQKFGGAFGGAAVMWILAGFGYDTAAGAAQTETAVLGLKMLMSFIPALVALIAGIIVALYPLTTEQMKKIQHSLETRRMN